MFKTYVKLAYRNLIKDKAYSVLNISGLTIGLASSILILLWVQNELSYDKFHKNASSLYRITSEEQDSKTAQSTATMAAVLKEEIPTVKNAVRTDRFSNPVLLQTGEKKILEGRVHYADPSFLEMFTFPLAKGDPTTALKQPNGILITQAMATKYFGNENPIGRVFRTDNTENMVVTGVFAPIPDNTQIKFDFILPLSSLARSDQYFKRNLTLWEASPVYTYVQLDKNFDPTPANILKLENQITQIYHQHLPKAKAVFHLQPLTEIHLAPELGRDLPGHGNPQYVKIFFIVAILILVVACINFMNLATARSARRAKEIGLRKVSGAQRGQLIFQFLSESVLISFLALFFAFWIVYLFLPVFNQLSGKQLIINLADGKLWISLLTIAILTGLISGSYPAFFLSGFNLVKILKGNVKSTGGNLVFRSTLVVIQFSISIILLIGTVVIYQQLKFIKERNPGFEKANLLYMDMVGDMYNKPWELRAALKQSPLTSDFTMTSKLPVNMTNGLDATWDGKASNLQSVFSGTNISENFTHVFGIKLLAGRDFKEGVITDSSDYIVNEKMIQLMGLKVTSAIGMPLTVGNKKGKIIGVVKDFNFKPVQATIEPLILRLITYNGTVVIRTTPGNTSKTIDALEKISKELNPAFPFSFGFVDQDLADIYHCEQQMGNIFKLFAIIGIFISCLGLYGLSAFTAEQRTKEIGVRKVLGASVFNMVYLLSASITRLMFIAISIAIPISWFLVNKWLQEFAYHIHVSWFIFFFTSVSVIVIAWLTVSYESVKAAVVNPIKSLRTE
ncbi:MAG: ABC transporter permease [Mucilaginibacter sp.]|uniref:ABC transporter permease n=1 Tax=Mucilaginibacter sp. TaxID=1882438 RepID=UPI0031AC2B2D